MSNKDNTIQNLKNFVNKAYGKYSKYNDTIEMFTKYINQMLDKFLKFKKNPFNSWLFCSIQELKSLMNQHIIKFHNCFGYTNLKEISNQERKQLKDDLIDISNYCLMIYNRLDDK